MTIGQVVKTFSTLSEEDKFNIWWEFTKELPEQYAKKITIKVHQESNTEKTFTLEEVKQYAFWAVQYAAKLEKENPNKIIHKSQIDDYLDFELS